MASFAPLAYLIITYIFSIICIQPSIGGGWSSGTYYDLDGSTFTAFNADASLWYMSAYADGTSKVSFCNNIYILGGYNILGPYNSAQTNQYFSRTYSGGALATTHDAIDIMYTFQPVDSWDSTDYYQVQFDTMTPLNGNHFIYTSATAVNLCGNLNQFDQEPMLVRVTIPHTASTLTIKFISQMDQGTNDESFGVRDIYITPYVSATTVTASLCGIAKVTLSDAICACSTPKFYQSPVNSGTCYPCHYNCATCTGPASNECTSCRAGMYLVGTSCYDCDPTCAECTGPANNQCISCYEYYFLALNSSCVEPCDWPLKRTSNSTQQYCESPCYPETIRWDRSCVTSTDPDPCVYPLNPVYESTVFPVCEYICDVYDFLYWDQTCLEHCYFPLVNVTKFGRQFCTFPCQTSPDTILYWDGVCRSSCNFPLIPSVWKGETFCHYPCTTSQYLYWNGSCLDTCDTPLQVRIDSDTGVVYCDFPCTATQVAYWDGSCNTSCPAPPILKSEGSPMVRYFCTFQCEIDEFLYWDGSCSDACPPPLKYEYFKSRSFCLYPCSSTEYLSYDGTCQAACNSPLTIRIQGGEKFCDLNCPGLQYLYWNGTCSDTCDSPLLASDQYFGRFCQFPCGSQTDFLYWNGTCSASCSLPYTQKTVGTVPNYYCLYPCSASEYLYYNGSCGQTCSVPLSIQVQDGLQYCDYPCTGVTPSIYLFWDGTCVSTCASPRNIRAESALWQFCEFPCASSSMFLYWDGSCSDYCTSPLTQHTEGSGDNIRKFCDYPCNSGEYLNFDGTCITSCPSPFRSTTDKGMQFCDSPCTSVFEYYYPSDNSCSTKCESPYTIDNQTYSYSQCLSPVAVVQEGWFVSNILTPPAGNQVTFSAVGTMTQHLRFLDINMPSRLQKLAASRGRPVFSLKTGIIMSADMQEDFPDTILPTAFQAYNLHASFLVNFWGDLISIFIIIVAALVTIILDKISNMHNSIVWKQVTSILKYLFKWNCVIILCTTLLEDIILFSSIQFRTSHLTSSSQAALFSMLICCVIFILGLIYVGGISYLVYQSYRIAALAPKRVTSNRLEKFREKTSQIQVIFKGFKIDALYKHSFYIIYILRICLPMILAAYLFAYPLPQMMTQTVINIAIIVYLLVVKPLEKKINSIQLLVSESISLIINLCLLTLTSLDFAGVEMNDSMIHLGDAIIIAFYVLNISTIVFLVIKIMQEASAIRKSNPKESTLLSKITYLQLLAIPIQQCGMGFEELIDKRDYLSPKVAPSIEKVTSTVQNIIMTTEMSPGFVPFNPLNALKPSVQNKAVRAVTPNIGNELRSTIYSQHDSFRDLLDGSVSQRQQLRFGETMNKKRMTDGMKLDESPIINAQAVTVTRMLHRPSFVKSVSRDDILNTLGNESHRENTEPSQFWSPDPFRRNSEL